MGMPLRIDDELVLRARLEAEESDRSITGQIEHWVKLGMALEEVLDHGQTRALKRQRRLSAADALKRAEGSDAQKKALAHLRKSGEPRYGMDEDHPGRLVRIDPDGTRTVGRFVRRVFVPDANARAPSPRKRTRAEKGRGR